MFHSECLLIQNFLKSRGWSENQGPPITGKGPNDLWLDCHQGGLDTSVISISIHLLWPMNRPEQNLVKEGKLLLRWKNHWNQRLSRITESLLHIPENWPVLGLRNVASRIPTCQGTGENPQQMVRPLGMISRSWQQKQSDSASLSTPRLWYTIGHCQDWAFALRELELLVLRLLYFRNWKWPWQELF